MDIKELINSGANISITVNALDLKDFMLSLISEREEEKKNAIPAQDYVSTNLQEQKDLLTRVDLCCRWNVSKGTLYNYTAQGLITPIKIGRRVLFPMSEVLRAESEGINKFKR